MAVELRIYPPTVENQAIIPFGRLLYPYSQESLDRDENIWPQPPQRPGQEDDGRGSRRARELKKFTLFSSLPLEIRRTIWNMALQPQRRPRVVPVVADISTRGSWGIHALNAKALSLKHSAMTAYLDPCSIDYLDVKPYRGSTRDDASADKLTGLGYIPPAAMSCREALGCFRYGYWISRLQSSGCMGCIADPFNASNALPPSCESSTHHFWGDHVKHFNVPSDPHRSREITPVPYDPDGFQASRCRFTDSWAHRMYHPNHHPTIPFDPDFDVLYFPNIERAPDTRRGSDYESENAPGGRTFRSAVNVLTFLRLRGLYEPVMCARLGGRFLSWAGWWLGNRPRRDPFPAWFRATTLRWESLFVGFVPQTLRDSPLRFRGNIDHVRFVAIDVSAFCQSVGFSMLDAQVLIRNWTSLLDGTNGKGSPACLERITFHVDTDYFTDDQGNFYSPTGGLSALYCNKILHFGGNDRVGSIVVMRLREKVTIPTGGLKPCDGVSEHANFACHRGVIDCEKWLRHPSPLISFQERSPLSDVVWVFIVRHPDPYPKQIPPKPIDPATVAGDISEYGRVINPNYHEMLFPVRPELMAVPLYDLTRRLILRMHDNPDALAREFDMPEIRFSQYLKPPERRRPLSWGRYLWICLVFFYHDSYQLLGWCLWSLLRPQPDYTGFLFFSRRMPFSCVYLFYYNIRTRFPLVVTILSSFFGLSFLRYLIPSKHR